MAPRQTGDPALRIAGMTKAFGGNPALDDVSLEIGRGEIVGLLGHNGSGKSTLIKCLAGYFRPDAVGALELYGRPFVPGGRHHRAIAFVHQDLGLIPSLSITENFLLTGLDAAGRSLSWRRIRAGVQDALDRFGLALPADGLVSDLSQADRCLVAVVRALDSLAGPKSHGGGQFLVLDEPTPFLPAEGVERLFRLVRDFAGRGGSVVIVAHDIDEVLSLTDRMIVLRDGRKVAEFDTAATARDQVVTAIVGKELQFHHAARAGSTSSEGAFHLGGLAGAAVRDVSFSLARGEVLGLTGLVGSGASDIPELIAGARRATGGTLATDGGGIALRDATVAGQMARGICLLPDDRLRKSGSGELTVAENIALPALRALSGPTGIRASALRRHVAEVFSRSGAVPDRVDAELKAFSGGNQQKILMAKWLALAPRLFLMSEPTQGVDVGSRQAIYAAIEAATLNGTSVLCYSTDAGELAQICDRVLIVAQGRVVRELAGDQVTKDAIVTGSLGTAMEHEMEKSA